MTDQIRPTIYCRSPTGARNQPINQVGIIRVFSGTSRRATMKSRRKKCTCIMFPNFSIGERFTILSVQVKFVWSGPNCHVLSSISRNGTSRDTVFKENRRIYWVIGPISVPLLSQIGLRCSCAASPVPCYCISFLYSLLQLLQLLELLEFVVILVRCYWNSLLFEFVSISLRWHYSLLFLCVAFSVRCDFFLVIKTRCYCSSLLLQVVIVVFYTANFTVLFIFRAPGYFQAQGLMGCQCIKYTCYDYILGKILGFREISVSFWRGF